VLRRDAVRSRCWGGYDEGGTTTPDAELAEPRKAERLTCAAVPYRTIIEPFRIRSVEPLRFTTR